MVLTKALVPKILIEKRSFSKPPAKPTITPSSELERKDKQITVINIKSGLTVSIFKTFPKTDSSIIAAIIIPVFIQNFIL